MIITKIEINGGELNFIYHQYNERIKYHTIFIIIILYSL